MVFCIKFQAGNPAQIRRIRFLAKTNQNLAHFCRNLKNCRFPKNYNVILTQHLEVHQNNDPSLG